MRRMYAAMEDALLAVTGEVGNWSVRERLDGHRLEAVVVTADRPERVLVGTFESGLQYSDDGGETFQRVGADVLPDAVMSLAVSPHDSSVVWAGTEPSAVFRSTDSGRTWERRPGLTDLPSSERWSFPPRPHTHHVRWLEPDPHSPDRLYVGIEAGAFVRTPDGGETWLDHPDGARQDNHTLATHPDAEGLVLTAAGDGFAVTRDGGDTWDHPQDGLDHRYCWSVAVDPGDPERLVLSAARGARTAHWAESADTHVYRRTSADKAWNHVESDVLPTGSGVTRAVLATPGEPGVVYAANNHGLYRSRDAGASWTALDADWPERFREQTVRGLTVV